eukprot:tig00001154_g7287.t1
MSSRLVKKQLAGLEAKKAIVKRAGSKSGADSSIAKLKKGAKRAAAAPAAKPSVGVLALVAAEKQKKAEAQASLMQRNLQLLRHTRSDKLSESIERIQRLKEEERSRLARLSKKKGPKARAPLGGEASDED